MKEGTTGTYRGEAYRNLPTGTHVTLAFDDGTDMPIWCSTEHYEMYKDKGFDGFMWFGRVGSAYYLDNRTDVDLDGVAEVKDEASETSSHLVLVKAEFTDRQGNTFHVKRSKCRHYYMKLAGAKQMRVTRDQLKAQLTELANAL